MPITISITGRSGFNSRSRVGSDYACTGASMTAQVSIHAPAWGATHPRPTPRSRAPRFNSRSRVGSDLTQDANCGIGMFQFTLPRGERPIQGRKRDKRACFNSRSRVGSDLVDGAGGGEVAGFNSRSRVGSDTTSSPRPPRNPPFQFTLPRGERQTASPHPTAPRPFQFTLPRGERHQPPSRHRSPNQVSIHAPAWGATRRRSARRWWTARFNSRSRVGSDNNAGHAPIDFGHVSIHAPAWGAT